MGLYLAAAVVASALMAAGLLMMKARAGKLPAARGAGVPAAFLTWLRDPMWAGGLGLQTCGWALYVAALAGAPVSLVAVMMQGGIAMFVLFAVRFLGERARPAEWTGIGGMILAMILLALSLGAEEAEHGADARRLAIISIALLAAGIGPSAASRLRNGGISAAIVSGVVFGLGSLYTKALTQDFTDGSSVAVLTRVASDPYLYLTVAANLCGLITLQNAFHRARGIIVMPLSSALSNLVPIGGGIVAFGERLPADPTAAAMRVGAFVLTIAAGALLSSAREAESSELRPNPRPSYHREAGRG
jgi:uncharacterized membrane protein